jgi:hypothetical protein
LTAHDRESWDSMMRRLSICYLKCIRRAVYNEFAQTFESDDIYSSHTSDTDRFNRIAKVVSGGHL